MSEKYLSKKDADGEGQRADRFSETLIYWLAELATECHHAGRKAVAYPSGLIVCCSCGRTLGPTPTR